MLLYFSRDLKKCTGDWFYDKRVNRFSTMQGHELVRGSLKRPAVGEYWDRKARGSPALHEEMAGLISRMLSRFFLWKLEWKNPKEIYAIS